MILTIFMWAIFALFAPMTVTPESVASTLIGGLISLGLTQWLKGATGLQGVGALLLAIAISFAVAIIALLVSTAFSGNPLTYALLPSAALQIFAIATIAFKSFMADSTQNRL